LKFKKLIVSKKYSTVLNKKGTKTVKIGMKKAASFLYLYTEALSRYLYIIEK